MSQEAPLPPEAVSAIEKVAKEFAGHTRSLLAEAHARMCNPVDGKGVFVDTVTQESALRTLAAEALVTCGLFRHATASVFLITEKGTAVYENMERPKRPPYNCGMSNEDLECLGCGEKLGCIKPGHCYAVEGTAAFK